MRVAGVDLPSNKRLIIALTYVHGIGPYIASKVCAKSGIDCNIRVRDILGEQQKMIIDVIDSFVTVEGDLRSKVARNIKNLIAMKCYRGIRYAKGLPVRGQNTRNNAKNAKKFNGKSGL